MSSEGLRKEALIPSLVSAPKLTYFYGDELKGKRNGNCADGGEFSITDAEAETRSTAEFITDF